MRKLLVGAVGIALLASVAASAGGGVEAKLTVKNVFDDHGNTVVFGKISSDDEACSERRRVVVADANSGDTLGKGRARYGRWVIETPSVAVGDEIIAKAKRKTQGEGDNTVSCAKAKSKVFEVEKIVEH